MSFVFDDKNGQVHEPAATTRILKGSEALAVPALDVHLDPI
jgi:hypothetical protein